MYEEGDWLGLNAGSFLVRNSHRGRAFVDAVMEYGALDKRVDVGKMLSREIQGRAEGEHARLSSFSALKVLYVRLFLTIPATYFNRVPETDISVDWPRTSL